VHIGLQRNNKYSFDREGPGHIETMHYITRELRKYLTRIKTHSGFSPPVSILILGKRFCEKILNIGDFIALEGCSPFDDDFSEVAKIWPQYCG
jgi:hypothetical protein